MEEVADGVHLIQGDLKHGMNVYMVRDGDGVTQFDAGTRPMVTAVRRAAERLGGLRRVVLGHSHSDHRGTAPKLDAPVVCHPDEVRYAEAKHWTDTDYWDMDKLEVASVRVLYRWWLHNRWDGGPVKVAGTLEEGDEVAGFRVVHFPGHAPGQIGLWRESDRLILSTDTVYFADSARLKTLDEPSVPHVAWNWDHGKAIESVRKLAELDPVTILAGHGHPQFEERGWRDRLHEAADQAEADRA